jgi:hypothetical protein
MRLALATAVFAALFAAVPATAAAPGRIQVVAREFRFSLSRPQLRSGRWNIIEVYNLGEDEHDFRMQRIGGRKVWGLPKILPGQRKVLGAKLPNGRYRIWCSVADHLARGMKTQLRVVPPPPPRP